MKFNLTQVIGLTLAIGIFSCEKKSKSNSEPKRFSLEVVDSVQVDFLGEMMLMDYDTKSDEYLLASNSYREYLEVNELGEILNQNKFDSDGQNAVGTAIVLGYFRGNVTVLTRQKAMLFFRIPLRLEN